MDKIIVYVDDAEHALEQLVPMKQRNTGPASGQPTLWVLVACAPRMTRHVSKWVSHSARASWRNRWSEQLFAQIVPGLQAQGDQVQTLLAQGPLTALTDRLLAQHKGARVLDARRTRFGQDKAPVTRDQPAGHSNRWSLPGAAVGMGALLVMATD